jgi:hypothetical protein
MSIATGYIADVLYLLPDEAEKMKQSILSNNHHITERRLETCLAIGREIKLINGDIFQMTCLNKNYYSGIYVFGTDYPNIQELVGMRTDGGLPDDIVVLFADKQRSIFSAAYPSIESLEAEYRRKLSLYLPGNFEWRRHMACIQYAEYN